MVKKINSIWEFAKGKKSYAIAFLFIVLAGLKAEGYVGPEEYEVAVTVLGALGLASLRHGIK